MKLDQVVEELLACYGELRAHLRGRLRNADDVADVAQATFMHVYADVATLPGLTLTGRVIYTGSAYVDLDNTQELPSWTRLDIGALYAMKLDGKALTLRAGINNLADRDYWQTGGRNRFVVAEPRTWRLSATVDF